MFLRITELELLMDKLFIYNAKLDRYVIGAKDYEEFKEEVLAIEYQLENSY
jgi:hypothetical protein